MPEPATTFAALFEQHRLARGFTQAELARRLHVSQAQVSRWRSGETMPSPAAIEKIAALFRADQMLLLRLAGWLTNNSDATPATIDPQVSALYDATVARVREMIEGVPAVFVPTILAATRVSTELARDNVESAISEALKQTASGEIKQPPHIELAPPDQPHGRDGKGSRLTRRGPFTDLSLVPAGF